MSDTNFDGEIGSADLLDFLIAYGANVNELGSHAENWEDLDQKYYPLL